jgi:hypothetical protein
MKFMRLLLVPVTLLILSSCQSMRESIRNARIADEFTSTSKGYARIIRWHEFDKSTLVYIDEPLRKDFQKRIMAADQVKLVDYRVKDLECWPEKGTAEVTVEWDYYVPPSVTVKTLIDPQKWRYVEDKNRGGWLLTTLLPVFK